MSKNVKILLIVGAVFLFLVGGCAITCTALSVKAATELDKDPKFSEARDSLKKATEELDNAVKATKATSKLTFGKPQVKKDYGGSFSANVEAKNESDVDVNLCTITATFKNGDDIVGVANGIINELASGDSNVVQFISTDDFVDYTDVVIKTRSCM